MNSKIMLAKHKTAFYNTPWTVSTLALVLGVGRGSTYNDMKGVNT